MTPPTQRDLPTEEEVRSLVRRILEGVTVAPAPSEEAPASPTAPASEGIAVGADHGGYALKERIAFKLKEAGWEVVDCGTDSHEPVDYPDFARAVAEKVASGECRWGIVVDGAGIGSAMAANKVPGVRAAACHDISSARNSREHNHANVLTLGAGLIGEGLAWQIVEEWLATEWAGGRHARRVAKIDEIEKTYMALSQMNTEALVEAITREVLAALSSRYDMAETGEHVRQVVANGADRVAFHGEASEVPLDLAKYIDHTLLAPDATATDIDELCAEAERYRFASVCINPTWVRRAAANLRGTGVPVCTVIGFPLGANTTEIKAMEARKALRDGAREVDMVINIGALKSGDYELVYEDMAKVVDAAHEVGAICKVILETALLTDEEKVVAASLAKRARADFVKTSTGFGPGGATVYDVALMRETVGPEMGVKASGGVRTADDAEDMIAAGATRIGASAGVQIVSGSDGGDGDEGY